MDTPPRNSKAKVSHQHLAHPHMFIQRESCHPLKKKKKKK